MGEKENVWIDEDSFLKMAQIGWIDYNNARLDNNKLLGVEIPPRKRHSNKYYWMRLFEVTRFIRDYNEAKKNQHD
ncbi:MULTISPECIES: hypothetical protein [unclassified Providencia]|uniref:hypothetical protein n=1 Tax=unclassified Providencia TaxID=2633465 RepID=UPI002349EDD9|nr:MULTISPECIES: hypothetical protein [unclassified Providencia]HEP0304906.1 hypothetical protein [Providencia rettgeri]